MPPFSVCIGLAMMLISVTRVPPAAAESRTSTLPPTVSAAAPAGVSDEFIQILQKQSLPELMHTITENKPPRTRSLERTAGDVDDLRATPYLLQAYKEATHEGIRCKLLQSMGRLHDPSLFNWFVLRLKDPSVAIQCFSIWALGELRTPRAAAPLRQKLWNPSPFVRMAAIDALGKTGKDPDVAAELGTFLNDDNVQIRFLTAKALEGIAGPESVNELIDHLIQEPSLDVQEALAKTAGHFGGSAAAHHFIELLKNPLSQATEHWAEVGLKAGGPTVVIPVIAPLLDGNDFRLKVSAMHILSDLDLPSEEDAGGEWMNVVKRWSQGSDLVAREAAVRLLERLAAPEHRPERTVSR